jgi:hypothetical protein
MHDLRQRHCPIRTPKVWGETGREDEIDAIIASGNLRPQHGWKLILLLAFANFR